MIIGVAYTKLHEDAVTPAYAHNWDAGADLYAIEDMLIEGNSHAVVGTGIAIAVPIGYVGYINPRSGLASKSGITVLNAPGTIDCGYTGEIKVILHNTRYNGYHVKKGDRIAQLVIQPVAQATFIFQEALEDTERSDNGFGSTGE